VGRCREEPGSIRCAAPPEAVSRGLEEREREREREMREKKQRDEREERKMG